jgi:hypothetical protein
LPHPLSPSEQLAHSTVRIETTTSSGSGSGTGFFYKFAEQGEEHVPAIVTNKHVVNGAIQGKFVLTERGADGHPVMGKYHSFMFDNFQSQWIPHPDPNIDLCAMPIAPILHQAQERKQNFFYINLEKSLLLTQEELDDLVLMEDVVMVGYPNGIWDQQNNMPVFRKGITATHPNLNWNGKPEFLIDAACFPGSSGSPVFLFNQGGFSTKSKGLTIGPSRVKLLGVLYAGPQHTVSGEIKVVQVPTQNVAVPISTIPNNLGMVIKASELEAFETIFKSMK